MNTVLIMAGGTGTRFWPLSRRKHPKQFLNLIKDNKSMLQLTYDRINKFVDDQQIFIATNKLYVEQIKKQLPNLVEENIIVEPYKRNTAPCIGLAAIYISKKFPESTITVLPSDHLIKNNEKFLQVLGSSVEFAAHGENIITLGIKPNKIETGYGYIHLGKKVYQTNNDDIYKVKEFTEKPDYKKAQKFYEDGMYYWNSGMFVFKSSTILSKFESRLPQIYKSLHKISKAIGTQDEKTTIDKEFFSMENISIDYGILEKDTDIYVVPAQLGWNDIGSWTALEDINKKDNVKNIVKSKHLGLDTNKSIIYNENNDKIITTIGVDNLIIVNTEDAILVCNKNNAQDVKKLKDLLNKKGLDKYL